MTWVNVNSAVDYADTLLTDFDGATTWAALTAEMAPTITQILFSAATVAAVNLRIFLAPAVGAAAEDQVELFNQAVGIGPIAVGRYVVINGGQGGCSRSFRESATTPLTLRATSTGLAGVNSKFRIEWNKARAMT